MRSLALAIILMFIMTGTDRAQSTSVTHEVTSYRRILVYDGPGITHREAGILNPGIPVKIVERNRSGMWLRIQREAEGTVALDGWVLGGFLNRPPELHYSDVPLDNTIPDAIPENVTSQTMASLYEMPILPTISNRMIEVFKRGQEVGNHADVITKVGDSLSVSDQYITLFREEQYVLGAYDYLESALLYYRDATFENSVAAQIGLTTYVVFDPFWATDERCQSNESPLECEYRLKQPGVAFILFGPNDVRHMTAEEYDEQMRLIVDETLAAGIIPVLSTFSIHPDDALFWQGLNFNLVIKAISEDYAVPAINLWAAAQPLPEYGLDEDRIHLTATGFDYLKFDSGLELRSGIALQNLLVLHTLNEIYHAVGLADDQS